MKKAVSTLLSAVLAAAPFISLAAATPVLAADNSLGSDVKLTADEKTGYISWNADEKYPSHRANVLTPDFYIFAGSVDPDSAARLLAELNMEKVLKESGGKVTFVSPADKNGYTAEDLAAFEGVLQAAPINNVKMIGIKEGADFLNNIVAPKANYVAGMMIVGGQMQENQKTGEAIPVYLSSPTETAVTYFTQANNKANPYKELQKTVVADGEESLAEAFEHAWNQVFVKNYRSSNSYTEFYNAPALLEKGIDILEMTYDLTPAPVLEELDVIYNEKLHQSVEGMEGHDYAWFEYIPASAMKAEAGSVPLVVSIHGNQNDPRLQGDSSGMVEVAAREGFMVVSPEYQTAEENAFFTQPANTRIYGSVDGLGADGIIKLVEQLQKTYPQIDASRIYVTGLSQGGAMTSYLGVAHSGLFAAAASVSGVNVFRDRIAETMENYAGPEVAYMYMCGDHDFFQMIPVDGTSQHGTVDLFGNSIWEKGTPTDIYSIFNAYQQANHLDVTEMDMSANKWFGIALDNWHNETLGDRTMEVGTLSNDKGVVMKLAAIRDQAHWTYKPSAEYIWDFFNDYQRNPETKELIFVNSQSSTPLKEGWKLNDNDWIYIQNGAPVKGWNKINNRWYHFNNEGIMSAGSWIADQGKWYYVDGSGAMKAGSWLNKDGAWYYLGSDGAMAADTDVDGYHVDASGRWVE